MDDRKPDLLAVMRMAGVQIPPEGARHSLMLRCPFHEDGGRPNLSVDAGAGLFHCFRCGVGGDVYDFQGLLLFGDAWENRQPEMFRAAIERLEGMDVPAVDLKPPTLPKELTREVAQVLALASRVYHLALMTSPGEKARGFLQSRCIDNQTMRRHRIGYASGGTLFGALAGYPPSTRGVAVLAGLFVDAEGKKARDWLLGRIVFPDITRGGTVRHMIGRSAGRKRGLKYLSLGGLPKTIWGLGDVSFERPVILTESIIDAVNLRQMGLQGVAANGTGIAGYLLPELRQIPQLLLLPQNDPAGAEAVARWVEKLPRARCLAHPFGDGEKDLNDQVVKYGLEAAADAVRDSLARAGIRPASHSELAP